MAIDIRERMEIGAAPEVVWTWMLEASNVVGCLPGATLLEVKDPRHFTAQMTIKVGPVSVTYAGDIELAEVDEVAKRVGIVGKWKEKGGSGSARMRIQGAVLAKDGGTEVTFDGQAEVAGRIAQFGRGMIDGVAAELFKQFATKVRERIEAAAPSPSNAPTSDAPAEEAPRPAPPAPAEPEALSALPLLFRALWTSIKRFFARIFSQGEG